MKDETKEWLKKWAIYAGIWAAALAATWGWTRMNLGNLAYMQYIQEKNQQLRVQQQQVEANELQLKQKRGECKPCPEEVEGGKEVGEQGVQQK